MVGFERYEAYDGLGLGALVRGKEVTPLELLEAALARIDARNPRLNAVVHRTDGSARAAAAGPLPAGAFTGVPLLLKDLLASVAGEPLTSSCRFMASHVSDHDSELVARLRRAGFVLAGRTNTPELGIMGVTEPALRGPARNPWSLDRTTGGSSGGAAAAVAAGIVPIAHGGDGGGSLRIPASCCGVFALKPTQGRNPLGPDFGERWCGLVQEHAITRTVRDSAALLDATAGPDLGAPYAAPAPARPFLDEVDADPGRLRIALTTESLFGETTHADCGAAVDDAAALLTSLGHRVEEARPPFDKGVLRRAYLMIVAANTGTAITEAGELMAKRPTPAGFEPTTWLLGLIGRKLPASEYQLGIDLMHVTRRQIARFFERYDLVLTPTLAHPPLRIGELDPKPLERVLMRVLRAFPVRRALLAALDEMASQAFEATANTMLFNITGQPAMSVPLFWNASGLPIGVQLAARLADEATLFRVAGQFERARPWFDRRPPAVRDLP